MSAREIRATAFRHSASLRGFTPVFDGLWTRVNALMAHAGYWIPTYRTEDNRRARNSPPWRSPSWSMPWPMP